MRRPSCRGCEGARLEQFLDLGEMPLAGGPPDYIFVTAWNYADVIRKKEEWFEGVWATPLPELRFFR